MGRILIYQGIIIRWGLGTAHCHLNFYRKLFFLALCLGCIDHDWHDYKHQHHDGSKRPPKEQSTGICGLWDVALKAVIVIFSAVPVVVVVVIIVVVVRHGYRCLRRFDHDRVLNVHGFSESLC